MAAEINAHGYLQGDVDTTAEGKDVETVQVEKV